MMTKLSNKIKGYILTLFKNLSDMIQLTIMAQLLNLSHFIITFSRSLVDGFL